MVIVQRAPVTNLNIGEAHSEHFGPFCCDSWCIFVRPWLNISQLSPKRVCTSAMRTLHFFVTFLGWDHIRFGMSEWVVQFLLIFKMILRLQPFCDASYFKIASKQQKYLPFFQFGSIEVAKKTRVVGILFPFSDGFCFANWAVIFGKMPRKIKWVSTKTHSCSVSIT